MSNPTPLHEREHPNWEFHPEFQKDVMPHLEDWSWHNDTKPCFVDGDTGMVVWVDHLDPKQREFPEDSYVYTLLQAEAGPVGWDHTDCHEILLETDDLSAVKQMLYLEKLGQAALPVTEDDWGSCRQIDAENDFLAAVQRVLPEDSWDDLYVYGLKATTEERIAYALQLVKKEVTS